MTTPLVRHPDVAHALAVARGDLDGDYRTAAATLAIEVGTLRGRLADAREDRRAAWADEHRIGRELSDVLVEVRAMLDDRSPAAASALRKRIGARR